MSNLDPAEHDNVINPYTLSEDAQHEVMQAIDDKRLSNPSGDYFKLETDDGTLDIPKLPQITQKTSQGKIRSIPIQDFINNLLSEI